MKPTKIKIHESFDNFLSPTECKILFLYGHGYGRKEMAQHLGVSLSTVKTHVGRLLKKTGQTNLADSFNYCYEQAKYTEQINAAGAKPLQQFGIQSPFSQVHVALKRPQLGDFWRAMGLKDSEMSNHVPRLRLELDLESLHQVLGGNTEVGVELRTAIVEEFARRHLKAIATAPILTSIANSLRAGVEADIHGVIDRFIVYGRGNYSQRIATGLTPEGLRLITDHIDTTASTIIKEACVEYCERQKEEWEARAQVVAAQLVDASWRRLLDEAIQNRIREITERVHSAVAEGSSNT